VWLDSKHTPVNIHYKLTAHWFVPMEVLESRGTQVTLDLPETFGMAYHKVNIRWLKFFEEQGARLGFPDLPPNPFVTKDSTARYEIKHISHACTHKGQAELWFD